MSDIAANLCLWMPPTGFVNNCDGGRSHTYCDYRYDLIYWYFVVFSLICFVGLQPAVNCVNRSLMLWSARIRMYQVLNPQNYLLGSNAIMY